MEEGGRLNQLLGIRAGYHPHNSEKVGYITENIANRDEINNEKKGAQDRALKCFLNHGTQWEGGSAEAVYPSEYTRDDK